MKPDTPLISVIMPAHNAERFIASAIESVLAQSYTYFELLVIDDASTDRTGEIVRSITDPRVVYHPVERIGYPSGVRNTGLRMAKGEFLCFLDADDLYFPQTLEKLSTILVNNPAVTAAFGFAAHMDESGNPLPERDLLVQKTDGSYSLPSIFRHTWEKISTGEISCLLPGLMLRRETLDRVGLFNESLYAGEDYEYYVRLYLDNFEGVYCMQDYAYRYRVYASSITKSPEHCEKIVNSIVAIMDWYFAQNNLPPKVYPLKSRAYIGGYRYLARERLLNRQPHLARYIVYRAFRNPNVRFRDWVKQCLPLFIRSFLPGAVNGKLVSIRGSLRKKYYKILHQFQS